MSSSIKILDRSVFERIAAGEVIENPSSVVKELVENSIDAGSSSIKISVTGGGLESICVADDGNGIDMDEAETAFLRHATSKLNDFEDLDKIITLGFRGEALASIAAVSKCEMLTKTRNSDTGVQLYIEGGELISNKPASALDGTTLTVKELFYNTPARLKFLKKPNLEAATIADLISRYILCNTDISLELRFDDRSVYTSSGDGKLINAINSVYGYKTTRALIDVSHTEGDVYIHGYIGDESIAKGNRKQQSLFINGRYVTNQKLSFAVLRAFENRLMRGKFPFFVLNIEMPHADVDVNVHPKKMEVKFRSEESVFSSVYKAVCDALANIGKNGGLIEDIRATTHADMEQLMLKSSEADQYVQAPEDLGEGNDREIITRRVDIGNKSMKLRENDINVPDDLLSIDLKPRYSVIGTFLNTYLLVEISDKLVIVDQHAAHEKFMFERLMQKRKNDQSCSQQLLLPVRIDFNFSEKQSLLNRLDMFEESGFCFDIDSDENIAVTSIPAGMDGKLLSEFFYELLEGLEADDVENKNILVDKIIRKACRKAVKAGDSLSEPEMKSLIDMLLSDEGIPKCPHGRPILQIIDRAFFENIFGRS